MRVSGRVPVRPVALPTQPSPARWHVKAELDVRCRSLASALVDRAGDTLTFEGLAEGAEGDAPHGPALLVDSPSLLLLAVRFVRLWASKYCQDWRCRRSLPHFSLALPTLFTGRLHVRFRFSKKPLKVCSMCAVAVAW